MTAKAKETKRRKGRSRQERVVELHASVEDDLLSLADEDGGGGALEPSTEAEDLVAVDIEVVD